MKKVLYLTFGAMIGTFVVIDLRLIRLQKQMASDRAAINQALDRRDRLLDEQIKHFEKELAERKELMDRIDQLHEGLQQ